MMGSPSNGIRGYYQDATLDCTSFDHDSGKILWPKDKFFQDLNKIEYYKKEYQAAFD